MSLRLEFPDKYSLWTNLVLGSADRVFISTQETPKIGSKVQVDLLLPGITLQMVITGTVIGRRGLSERFPAGCFVRFSDEEIEKCRRFLGLSQSPERYSKGRKAQRVPCIFPARFIKP